MQPNAWHKQTLSLQWFLKKFADRFGDIGWPKEFYETV
jgi:hypothetical protein